MKRTLVLSGILILAVFALASSPAKADNIDFGCSGGACSGTVVSFGTSPVNYSTTGITGIGGISPGITIAGESGDTFSLVFDTSTNSIQILENGVVDFAGTITSVSQVSPTPGVINLQLLVTWTTIPGDVSGNTGVTPTSSVISIQTSAGSTSFSAFSVDVPIFTSSVPEPSSLLLLGAGLLLLGTKKLFAIG